MKEWVSNLIVAVAVIVCGVGLFTTGYTVGKRNWQPGNSDRTDAEFKSIMYDIKASHELRKKAQGDFQLAPQTIDEYADILKKRHNAVHIFQRVTHTNDNTNTTFAVYVDHKDGHQGIWCEAATFEEAQGIVKDYYRQWARLCTGNAPEGKFIE